MRRVLLGTPSYDSKVDVRYTHAFGLTIKLCMEAGIHLQWLFPWGDQLQNARNGLVRDAVKYDFDDLIFIDADQTWEPAWVLRLLGHPVDCVGSAVRRKTDEAEMYNVKALGGPNSITTDLKTGLMTAPDMALGTGFIRLSRKALKVLWDNAEPYTVFLGKNEPSRWIFDIRPHDGELRGEDTFMCDALRAHGIPTWLDPTMTCDHVGLKVYAGNFADFLKRAQTAEAADLKPSLKVVS